MAPSTAAERSAGLAREIERPHRDTASEDLRRPRRVAREDTKVRFPLEQAGDDAGTDGSGGAENSGRHARRSYIDRADVVKRREGTFHDAMRNKFACARRFIGDFDIRFKRSMFAAVYR